MQSDPLTPETQATLDRLIPPPWRAWRRWLLALGFAAVPFAFAILWGGGWLAPNLAMEAAQWGGEGPVTMGIHLTNNGPRTIEILSADTSPGLTLVSATAAEQPLPALLAPGQTVLVLTTFEVADCGLIDISDDTWGIEVQFADGPLRMRRQVEFFSGDLLYDQRAATGDSSWAGAVTQYVCP